jgi:hypothetical protein
MASALRKMTSVGADVRQIAALLQAKAPQGHMLAYITPQEAALLKAQGGSGEPDAETGIPSFQEDFETGFEGYVQQGTPEPAYSGPSGAEEAATVGLQPQFSETISAPPPPGISIFGNQPVDYQAEFGGAPVPETPATYGEAGQPRTTAELMTLAGRLGPTGEAVKPEKPYADRLAEALGISKDTLGKLGVAGIQGLLGGRQAAQAREAGQAGRREIQAVAAPYQAQGQQLQAAAQRGELTPTGQQAIAAARAQAAQGAERRGGVGAQQTEAQVQALRNQLLQQQYDYGLKLSGIGDQMALGAIRTGMQADQYANQLTSSYFSNIARIAAGTPAATRPEGA